MEVSLVCVELSVNHFKGLFSERHLEEINECTYDPPYAGKGATPGWAAGSTKQVKQITDGIPTETESYDSDYGYDDGYEYDYRKKRKRRFDMGGIYGKRLLPSVLNYVITITKAMAPATTVQAVIMVASTVMILMAVMALTMIQLSWNVLPMILRAVTTLMPGLKLLVS